MLTFEISIEIDIGELPDVIDKAYWPRLAFPEIICPFPDVAELSGLTLKFTLPPPL